MKRAACKAALPRSIEDLPGIENPLRIERILERLMNIKGDFSQGLADPWFLRETDAVFAGDRAAMIQHPGEELIERLFRLFPCRGIFKTGDHQVRMDIANSRVSNTFHGDSRLFLQQTCEFHQLDET